MFLHFILRVYYISLFFMPKTPVICIICNPCLIYETTLRASTHKQQILCHNIVLHLFMYTLHSQVFPTKKPQSLRLFFGFYTYSPCRVNWLVCLICWTEQCLVCWTEQCLVCWTEQCLVC